MLTRIIPCDHEMAQLERDYHDAVLAAADSGTLPEELADLITIRVEITGNARETLRRIYLNWQ